MTYTATLDYIFSKLPMFSRIGSAAIKNGLTNITALCNHLGHPERRGRHVHVAGTNGKGSVSHMLASILQSAGYSTGLYTSPHLTDLRERIKINGAMITEQAVVHFIETHKPLIEQINPSFFEINVAMAFQYFAANTTDINIIETGLGGRLDSTNIIHPLVSIITNISYDHMAVLGNTLPEIAFEKAGIIKPCVPVIIGEHNPETAPVFEKVAIAKKAPLTFASMEWVVHNTAYIQDTLQVTVTHRAAAHISTYQLDLTGNYQTKNLLAVLQAVQQLQQLGYSITPQNITEGLLHVKKNTGLHGRWETIDKNPLIVLDVAHNEEGMQQVLQQLRITPHYKLHLIIGMVKDKDVEKVLSLLPQSATYYFTQANVPRAMPASILQRMALAHGLRGHTYTHVNEAIASAKKMAGSDDLIVVCGSVFLVGEVNRSLYENNKPG